MPKVIPVHQAVRDSLRKSVSDALGLNAQLEVIVAVKPNQPGNFHGKVDFSQPPWHAPVANAITDLHALSREIEAWLRLSQGLPKRERGGSSENTKKALENVIRLSEAAQDGTVRGHTKDLNRWNGRAEVALGKKEMPSRLPREKGQPARTCPWCGQDTLRTLPLKGTISCIDVKCVDDENQRPRGAMEFSAIVADWVVVWQNGWVGLP